MDTPDSSARRTSTTATHKRQNSRVVPAIPRQLAKPRPKRASVGEAQLPTKVKSSEKKQPETVAVVKEDAEHVAAIQEDVANGEGKHVLNSGVQEEPPLETKKTSEVSLDAAVSSLASPKGTPALENTSDNSVAAAKISRLSLSHLCLNGSKSELPPPFYPAAMTETAPSQAPTGAVFQPPPPTNTLFHPAHPSADNIIFGGNADSSSASPALPGSAGSAVFPPPGSLFMNGGPPPPLFSTPGHAHQFSGAYNSSQVQHMPLYDPRYGGFHPSHPYPPGLPPAFINQRPGFAPQDAQRHITLNGYAQPSRSNSQASIPSAEQQDSHRGQTNHAHRPTLSGHATPGAQIPQSGHQTPLHNGNGYRHDSRAAHAARPVYIQQSQTQADEKNLRDIGHLLRSQFGSFEFADYVLEIADDATIIHTLPCHSLILSRSPKFQEIMRSTHSHLEKSHPNSLHIPKQYYFRRPDAFIDAMRYLYAGSLLDEERFLHECFMAAQQSSDARPVTETWQDFMAYALSYSAAGLSMEVAELALRGISVATRLLRWENIDSALAFSLAGGLSPAWRDGLVQDDRGSSTSSDESVDGFEISARPNYDPHATEFLHHIINFICFNFPRTFTLRESAPQLTSPPRLPSPGAHSSRTSISHPRLKGIRFGDAPLEESKGTSLVATTLSGVLLSLPFLVLKAIFNNSALGETLGTSALAQIMQDTVTERERRRTNALKDYSARPADLSTYTPTPVALLWEEALEPSEHQRSGLNLVRQRKGIDTPPSIASAASK